MSVIWPDKAKIFAAAEPIIKGEEGLRLVAYLCPAKKWTLGWGCTMTPDGHAIEPGMKLSGEAEAEVYLQASADRILSQLERSNAVQRSPNINQAAALLDLAYNVGVGVHDGHKGDLADSSLLDAFNHGDIQGAADRFMDWDKAKVEGVVVVLPGLFKRRSMDRDLFLRAAA